MTHGAQRGHVERSSHIGTPAPDRALSTHLFGVAVQGRHTKQGGDAAPIELAQLEELGQQHGHAGRTDARHAGKRGGEFGMVALPMGGSWSASPSPTSERAGCAIVVPSLSIYRSGTRVKCTSPCSQPLQRSQRGPLSIE